MIRLVLLELFLKDMSFHVVKTPAKLGTTCKRQEKYWKDFCSSLSIVKGWARNVLVEKNYKFFWNSRCHRGRLCMSCYGWCVLQNAECWTQNGLYGQRYQCESKLVFKFINQKIIKSSETNLVYLDWFHSESDMIVTWFSPSWHRSWLSSPSPSELELSWRYIDRKWFCCDCGLPD